MYVWKCDAAQGPKPDHVCLRQWAALVQNLFHSFYLFILTSDCQSPSIYK